MAIYDGDSFKVYIGTNECAIWHKKNKVFDAQQGSDDYKKLAEAFENIGKQTFDEFAVAFLDNVGVKI